MDLFEIIGRFTIEGTDEARNRIKDVTGTAQESSGIFSTVGGKIAGAVATAFATQKIVAFGKDIIGTTQSFSDAMLKVQSLSGASKEELADYALAMYPEIAKLDYDTLKRTYKHEEEICQKTVPQAIYCFLISSDFEDCLRTTISSGGDCDTTAAISCAIAEAYYNEIPQDLVEKVKKKLTPEMLQVISDYEWQLNMR